MARPVPARRARTRLVLAALLVGATSACSTGGGGAAAARGASFLPPSRPAQFSMAGISWGIDPDSVTALVEPRGYNLNSVDPDGDLLFDGVLFRAPTRVFAFMSSAPPAAVPVRVASSNAAPNASPHATRATNASGGGRLVKLRVYVNTEDPDALPVYEAARAELVKQYGAPTETEEHFQAPYRKGDGKEIEAFRAGKAHLRTYWVRNAGGTGSARTAYVAVQVTRELTVAVDYEGAGWERESLRRRRQVSR